ncbi:MAG: outer membrane beta-barrel protein [Burkholderiales bacterium]
MTTISRLAAFLMSVALAGPAVAQQRGNVAPRAATAEPGWYIGAGIGNSKIPENWADSSLPVAGATASSLQSTRSSALGRAFAGFRVNPNFAIELGYIDLGRFGLQRDVTAPTAGNESFKWTVRSTALDALLIWPVANSVDLFARLGVAYVATRSRFTASGLGLTSNFSSDERSHKYALHYGLGAQFQLTRSLGLRADWELFKKASNSNAVAWADGREVQYQSVSASAIWKF